MPISISPLSTSVSIEVNVDGNVLDSEGMRILSASIKTSVLESLYINTSSFGDEAAKILSEGIENCSTLTVFYICTFYKKNRRRNIGYGSTFIIRCSI